MFVTLTLTTDGNSAVATNNLAHCRVYQQSAEMRRRDTKKHSADV